jgi:hypothetical protein
MASIVSIKAQSSTATRMVEAADSRGRKGATVRKVRNSRRLK